MIEIGLRTQFKIEKTLLYYPSTENMVKMMVCRSYMSPLLLLEKYLILIYIMISVTSLLLSLPDRARCIVLLYTQFIHTHMNPLGRLVNILHKSNYGLTRTTTT